MSIIHIRHIEKFLENTFSPHIDLSDVGGHSRKNTHLLLSRCLVAYSIQLLSHISIEEACSSVTDGTNDNGIDAVFIDESCSRLYVAQSKWITKGVGEPDLGAVKKFTDGIIDLINLRFDRFNNKVRKNEAIIQRALEDPAFKLSVILSHTGMEGPAQPILNELEDLISSLNDANEVVELHILKQPELHRGLKIHVHGEPVNIDVTITAWGKVTNPHPAWYGQVAGQQVAQWWNDYHDRLFSKNLRGLLSETDINTDIRNTLLDSPELFWYFNNGITLVANSVERPLAHAGKTDVVTLHCTNVSVVNGAQTVGTIGRYAANPSAIIDNVTVPIRVIDLGETGEIFGRQITRSNNRQNRIESRDFIALDDEQKRLQEELAAEGVSYQLLRSGEFISSDNAFDVVESTTALACATGDGVLAVQLKREIGRLWDDLGKAPYRKIFNPSITGLYVWRCVRTQRIIDDSIGILMKSSSLTPELKGVLVHGNRIISALVFSEINVKRFDNPDYEIDADIKMQDIQNNVLSYAESLSNSIEQNFSKMALPILFKNSKKCSELISASKGEAVTSQRQMALDFSDLE